jgi:phenylpropionate dioxygenase-like ring-hydroxylating dioxygenase large terminal subunit
MRALLVWGLTAHQEGAVALDIARDFPYDYSLLVENLVDVGHVHFTHQCASCTTVDADSDVTFLCDLCISETPPP